MTKRGSRRAALEAHDRVIDRLVFLAIKRREAEKELREYEAVAHAVAETVRRG